MPLPARHAKWNEIEHRLFSAISMNWRGRPLTSREVIVQAIAATTTRTVHALLGDSLYPTGVKVSDQQMAAVAITRHGFPSDWNSTLHPPRARPAGPPDQGRKPPADGTAPPWPTPR